LIDMDRTPARKPKNHGQLASGVRAHWPWALVLGTAVFATTFAPVWGFVVLAIGLVLAGVKAAIIERVQEVFKRKPDLTLLPSAGAGNGTVIEAPTLRPWPIDVERIVAHEAEAARASEQFGDGVLTRLVGVGDSLAIRPSQAEKDRALAAFRDDVEEFAAELREWLDTYVTAADARSRTFELDFEIASATRGAHAEGVTLVLELPPGLEVGDEWPGVTPPPETPVYSPPWPRWISTMAEAPVRTDIAHHRPIVVHSDVLVALARGAHGEVWNRNPRHGEVGCSRLTVQGMPPNRHEVGQRQAPKIAVQRAGNGVEVAAGRPELGVSVLLDIAGPGAFAVMT
jgi:hypothetical protein